jgi:hypothetical protein
MVACCRRHAFVRGAVGLFSLDVDTTFVHPTASFFGSRGEHHDHHIRFSWLDAIDIWRY